MGARTWRAAPDEVFDATWLTLTARGFTVTEQDRLAGTLLLTRGESTWDVEIAALGSEQRVAISPRHQATRAELSELLDALEEGTRTLLRAWHDLPEWKYDGRRNRVSVKGFSLEPPQEWAWLDFDISRRFVIVQQRRARTGLNPTLLVEIDRRRPSSPLAASLRRGAMLALSTNQRLELPEVVSTRDQTGLHGQLPLDLVWHAYETALGPTDVRVIMVCPRSEVSECMSAWAAVAQSILSDADHEQ